ncbi:MAG: hypothetical protein L3K06_04240, partial [Thermoplasmata archaeon]|nr:hypothetical protein [Thermoplasmata archaeon]
MNDHAPVLVGVLAQDTARFSTFAASLTSLDVPSGSAIKWIIGHPIASSTNMLVWSLLNEHPDCEYLWLLGDDHVFGRDILMRLLDHDEDLIVPLCLTRIPPYRPVIFADWEDPDDDDNWARRRVDLNDHPDGGVIDVHSAGSGGMLIRRCVLDDLEHPWFESISAADTGEDVYFCDKARAVGYTVKADLDTKLGHMTTATVWPVKQP